MANQQYYGIATNTGLALLANAALLGTKVDVTQFAVGDANGSPYFPQPEMTALKNEVWRGNITDIVQNPDSPNMLTIQGAIPADVGGWTIAEIGAFDSNGNMVFLWNCAPFPKVVMESGQSDDVYFNLQVALDNADSVNISINPNVVLATKADINALRVEVTAKIDKVASDLSNHIDDTDIHMSKAFKENVNQNIQNTNNHINDETVHIQDGEREKWNAVIAKAAQNAKDIDSLEITVNDLTGRVGQLENDVYNDVVKYKFTFGFSDLDGVTVTSGNWNKAKKRLEC